MNTPVALLIFNRPETTERVFAEIARAKPSQLLVVADGPRPDRPDEGERCSRTRLIVERVDWPCEVLTNYSDVNMGCKRRVASGLDWVFDMVEEAIILEDDCLPHPTFFRFCEELLDQYRDDERIAHISGTNFFFGERPIADSYYFARNPSIWGWASWRRAWRHYDVSMALWPMIRARGFMREYHGGAESFQVLTTTLENIYRGKIDTWDYQWVLSCWMQNALAITPAVNLVSNIGFGGDATHAIRWNKFAGMSVEPMAFPLRHPPYVAPDPVAAAVTRKAFALPPLLRLLFHFPPSMIDKMIALRTRLRRHLRPI